MKTIKIYLKQNKKFLIILLCFSFLIRAILFQFFLSKNENYWTADSQPYNEVAVQIAQGNGIVIENQVASFYRLPGYPAILSVGYKLFNFDIKKTLWLQIFFACLIPILIFCLSLALFPQNILLARVSSIYSAIHLGFVVFSGLLMSETFFVLFFLLFCLLFFSSFNLFFCSEVLTITSSQFPFAPECDTVQQNSFL